MSANEIQIGGDHYKKLEYEPWDVIAAWNLGYLDGNAVKYLARWKSKGGIADLQKAKHYIDKLIEQEQKKQMDLAKAKAQLNMETQKYEPKQSGYNPYHTSPGRAD